MNIPESQALTFVGLAYRAKKVSWGDTAVAEDTASGHAKLLLIASDAGAQTAEKFRRMSERLGTQLIIVPCNKSQLGGAVGRSPCAILSINDIGLAKAFLQKLKTE